MFLFGTATLDDLGTLTVAVPRAKPNDHMTIIADLNDFFVEEKELTVCLRLKRTFLENHKCPFCKGNLRCYGHKNRLYRDYINNRTLTYNIPRVQCCNPDCYMKELRKNIEGVTHLVLPNKIVPYFQCDSELIGDIGIAFTIMEDLKTTTSEIGKSICELRLEALRRKYESISEGLWQWLLDEFIHTPKALRYAKVWAMAVKEYQSLWCFNLANSEHFDDYSEIPQMPFSCVESLSDILPQLTSENVPQLSTYTIWPPENFFIKLKATEPLWLSDEKIWRDTS